MKKAFTMAEALITMGIIGIVAAFTLPAINQLRPDETKIKYLKAFDALQEATIALASNTKEYPVCGNVAVAPDPTVRYNFSDIPLANIRTSYFDTNNSEGNNSSISYRMRWYNGNLNGNDGTGAKFCKLLAWSLGVEDVNGCGNDATAWGVVSGSGLANMVPVSFTTKDGTDWYVRYYRDPPRWNWPNFGIVVIIDVNGTGNGPNVAYEALLNNFHNPDRFYFFITADGKVYPEDPMGQAYLRTRNTTGKRDLSDFIRDNNLQYLRWVSINPATGSPGQNEVNTFIDITNVCQ